MLIGLLLLAVLPPFVARAFGTGLGAFAMFTRLERYHLDLGVQTRAGEERVEVRSLAPHLSRDARQIILPAASHGFGQEQIDELAGGLADIGVLLCALRPDAVSARARLSRGPLHGRDRATSDVVVACTPSRESRSIP
jgi:hypothetical protein